MSDKSFRLSCWLNFVGILLGCLTAVGQEQSPKGVTLSGTFTVTKFRLSGANRTNEYLSSTNEFRVSIATDGRWAFEISPAPSGGDIIYQTSGGSNIFAVYYDGLIHEGNHSDARIIGRAPLTNRLHTAYVCSGNYPFGTLDPQRRDKILWLVYGSGDYTRNSTDFSMPLPWIAAREDLLAYGFRFESETSSQPPYLSRELKLVRDSRLDLSDEGEFSREELDHPTGGGNRMSELQDDLRERRAWHDGFVAGKLTRSDFTNYNGLVFPCSFELTTFLPADIYFSGAKEAKMTGAAKPSWIYSGVVTNVTELSAQESFVPPILGRLGVFDARFRIHDSKRTVDQITYNIEYGGKWEFPGTPKWADHNQRAGAN